MIHANTPPSLLPLISPSPPPPLLLPSSSPPPTSLPPPSLRPPTPPSLHDSCMTHGAVAWETVSLCYSTVIPRLCRKFLSKGIELLDFSMYVFQDFDAQTFEPDYRLASFELNWESTLSPSSLAGGAGAYQGEGTDAVAGQDCQEPEPQPEEDVFPQQGQVHHRHGSVSCAGQQRAFKGSGKSLSGGKQRPAEVSVGKGTFMTPGRKGKGAARVTFGDQGWSDFGFTGEQSCRPLSPGKGVSSKGGYGRSCAAQSSRKGAGKSSKNRSGPCPHDLSRPSAAGYNSYFSEGASPILGGSGPGKKSIQASPVAPTPPSGVFAAATWAEVLKSTFTFLTAAKTEPFSFIRPHQLTLVTNSLEEQPTPPVTQLLRAPRHRTICKQFPGERDEGGTYSRYSGQQHDNAQPQEWPRGRKGQGGGDHG